MNRVTVTDQAVDNALNSGVLNITRDKWRKLKNFSREEFLRYIVSIYRDGFQAGCDAVTNKIKADYVESYDPETEEVQVNWEDILALIAEVKGVSPEILSEIDKKMKEVY